MFPSLVILAVLILVLVALFVQSSRRKSTSSDPHSRFVRIVCGGIFFLSLIAVGIGTWRGMTRVIASPEVNLKVPAKSALNRDNPLSEMDAGPYRFIATVLLVRTEGEQLVPVSGRSSWFQSSSTSHMIFRGEHEGASYTVTMRLQDLRGNIHSGSNITLITNGTNWSDRIEITPELDSLKTVHIGKTLDTRHHAPLSLIPISEGQLRVLILLTRTDSDDPLETIPASEWLLRNAKDLSMNHEPVSPDYSDASPGWRMLTFLGPSAVLLLIAAIAGSHCVRRGRRRYAFTGLVAAMVLHAGILDAIILHHRANLTADAGQPKFVRERALVGMAHGTLWDPLESTCRHASLSIL